MAFVDIIGPVGLRCKCRNVRNKSSDQEIILNLLSSIPASQGGRKEAELIRPLVGPNGSLKR
jgi:hypothetical protein